MLWSGFHRHLQLIGAFGVVATKPVGHLLEDVCARTEVEVRVEVRILVVLNSVVLPAESEVQSKTWRDFPAILRKEVAVVVAIAAREVRRPDRQIQSAIGCHHLSAVYRVAGKFSLRVGSALELVQVTGDQTIQCVRCAAVFCERLYGRLVGTEYTIISCVDIGAAELESMDASYPGDVTISFGNVLWSTEWDSISRTEWQIARKGDRITADEGLDPREEVQAGNNTLRSQWLLIVQPVEDALKRHHHVWREHACHGQHHVLVEECLPGIKASVRRLTVCSCEIVLAIQGVPAKQRGLVVDVVVDTAHQVVGALWESAT